MYSSWLLYVISGKLQGGRADWASEQRLCWSLRTIRGYVGGLVEIWLDFEFDLALYSWVVMYCSWLWYVISGKLQGGSADWASEQRLCWRPSGNMIGFWVRFGETKLYTVGSLCIVVDHYMSYQVSCTGAVLTEPWSRGCVGGLVETLLDFWLDFEKLSYIQLGLYVL